MLFRSIAKDYRVLTDLLLLQGRILEAQQVLELLKIQEIREFTRNAMVKNNNAGIATTAAEDAILKEHGTLIALGQKVFDCKRSQCAQLTQLNDQLQSLTQQYNQTVQGFSKISAIDVPKMTPSLTPISSCQKPVRSLKHSPRRY